MSDRPTEDDDMPDEIDFSGGVRGLHRIPPGSRVLIPGTMGCMSVEEIDRAIQALSASEFAQIAERVHVLEQERWDAELDRDASAGKLDFLIAEAQEDRERGRLMDWPPAE